MRSPRFYALGLGHKHLPEMQVITGLAHKPLFTPIVGNFAQGMVVAVPLLPRVLPKALTPADVHAYLSEYYRGETFVRVMGRGAAPTKLSQPGTRRLPSTGRPTGLGRSSTQTLLPWAAAASST